jgi:hypothetical protein
MNGKDLGGRTVRVDFAAGAYPWPCKMTTDNKRCAGYGYCLAHALLIAFLTAERGQGGGGGGGGFGGPRGGEFVVSVTALVCLVVAAACMAFLLLIR